MRAGRLLVAVLLSAPAGAAASETARTPSSRVFLEGWDDFVFNGAQRPGLLELRLQLGGEGWDNLRQSPASANPERTAAARSEARLTGRLSRRWPIKAHVEAARLSYRAREATSALGAGLAFEGDRHTLHLSARVERNRPSIDIGVGEDVTHDALLLRLRYALRTRRLEWWAGADRVPQRFPEAAFRDGTLQGVQTGLALPGVRRTLTPELVVAWSQGDVPGDSELDWQQRRAQVALRYTPLRALLLTARFELSEMEFGVTRPTAVNFARRDRRQYWSVQGQVRLTRQAAWTLAYDRVVSRSTLASRDFTADSVSAGLTFRLGSTTRPPNVPSPGAPARVPGRPHASGPAPAPPTPPAPAAPPAEAVEPVAAVDAAGPGLTRIEAARRGDDTEITLRGPGRLRYSTLDLDRPPRFVVDLDGVAAPTLTIPVDTPLVRGIRVAAFRPGPSRVARVVVDLKVPAAASVERDGDALRVVLRPLAVRASAASR